MDGDDVAVEAEGAPRSSIRGERSEVAVAECSCLVGESGDAVVILSADE